MLGAAVSLIECWFDGCCEPINPGGHASYGALLKLDGEKIWEEGQWVGYGPQMSNNVAEYSGFIACLQQTLLWLISNPTHNVTKVHIRGDSKLVIYHNSIDPAIKRKWNTNCHGCKRDIKYCYCKLPQMGLYYPCYLKAKQLVEQVKAITTLTLEWIPRDLNEECDRLSKGELITRGVEFKIQPEKPKHAIS